LHADILALEFRDAADALSREQLEAPDHHAGQKHQRFSGVNRPDALRGIERGKIDLTARDRPGCAERRVDVADIGETLRAQKLLGNE
jgi:hypothetical protein